MMKNDYPEEGLLTQAKLNNGFWYKHRNQIILTDLQRSSSKEKRELSILEIGAGAGNICGFLTKQGYRVDAAEMFVSALEYLDKRAHRSFVFDLVKETVPAQYKGRYDVVILGDVIEHLDQPISALRAAKEFLARNGLIIITVPAGKVLWSAYDEYCHHKKRYSREDLRQEVEKAGYLIESLKYFMFIPAILIFIARKTKTGWDKEGALFPWLNVLLSLVMRVESLVGQFINYPFGSSLILVGRAKENGR